MHKSDLAPEVAVVVVVTRTVPGPSTAAETEVLAATVVATTREADVVDKTVEAAGLTGEA
jgi:hypothetical protein